jgi:hypothetical protein
VPCHPVEVSQLVMAMASPVVKKRGNFLVELQGERDSVLNRYLALEHLDCGSESREIRS